MTNQPAYQNPLFDIRAGMHVHDSTGRDIGWVERVHLGGQRRSDPGEEVSKSASEALRTAGDDLPALDLAHGFAPDAVPEKMARALVLKGYICVGGGPLQGPARYILPERIAGVGEEGVRLAASLDNLRRYLDMS